MWTPKKRIHTYSDVTVVATPLELQEGRRDTIINPLMIIEVLSITDYMIHVQEYKRVFKSEYILDKPSEKSTLEYLLYKNQPSFLVLAHLVDQVFQFLLNHSL